MDQNLINVPFEIIIGALLIGISSNEGPSLLSDFPLPFLIDVTIIFFFLVQAEQL